MAWISKAFATKKKEEIATPQDAIQRLRETEEMLTKKSDFLEKKIEQEVATAKRHGTKNKRGEHILRKAIINNRLTKNIRINFCGCMCMM